jgi:hypothetical protein
MSLVERTVSVKVLHPDRLTPCTGTVTFKPGTGMLIDPADGEILAGATPPITLVNGAASITLATTDQTGIQPEANTWNWTVEFQLTDVILAPFSFALPLGDGSTVDLSTVARLAPAPGTYLVIPGPAGPKGDKGDQGDPGSGGTGTPSTTVTASTAFGQAPAAGSAASYSRGDHAHGTPATPTKTTVGLGNVDNTSDANKPISTAVQTALTAEVNRANLAYDPSGSAGAVTTALTAHTASTTTVHGIADTSTLVVTTDSRLTDHRTPTGTAGGDLAGSYPNPAVAKVAGATVSGTPATGKVLTATSGSAATWQTPTGGGSGVTIRSVADDRIDLEIVVLTNTATWAIVHTSGGVAIGKSVRATAGDRVLVAPDFMYTGSQYQLDLAVMAGDGSGPTRYASSSGTGTTPGPEGYAPYYTQLSFQHVSGLPMFTVAAGEVDGSGLFTVNLAYFAPSLSGTDQKLYFGSGYLGRWLMLNIGPEPA